MIKMFWIKEIKCIIEFTKEKKKISFEICKNVRKTKEEKECDVLLWCWDSEVLISLFDL